MHQIRRVAVARLQARPVGEEPAHRLGAGEHIKRPTERKALANIAHEETRREIQALLSAAPGLVVYFFGNSLCHLCRRHEYGLYAYEEKLWAGSPRELLAILRAGIES